MDGVVERGIRKRKNSFQVDITLNGKRLTATCKSLEEARRKRAELQVKLYTDEGSWEALQKRRKSWTLAEGAEYTYRAVWKKLVSGEKSRALAAEAIAFFGKRRPLNSITTEAMDLWVFDLETRRLSDASINHRLAALSKIMSVAVSRGGLDARPIIPRKKLFYSRMRVISVKEEQALERHLRRLGFDMQADAVNVLIDTGMRPGELLRLRERDVDFSEGIIHIWQRKTHSHRTVPMTKRVRKRLEGLVGGYPQRRVFPLREYDMVKAWDRARALMGLREDRHFTLYALRHTCASRIVRRGVNLQVVQKWMGHKSYATTLRYAHLGPENMNEAIKALESYRGSDDRKAGAEGKQVAEPAQALFSKGTLTAFSRTRG